MKTKNYSIYFLILIFLASFANNAIAISEWAYDKGTIQLSINSDNCNLLIAGEINEDLRRVVTPAIESIVAASCKNKWVQLKSGGGRVSVALAIGRLIRDNNLNTEIKNVMCASACGLIFISGIERSMYDKFLFKSTSLLGFHQIFSKENGYSTCKEDLMDAVWQDIRMYIKQMLPIDAANIFYYYMSKVDCTRLEEMNSEFARENRIANSPSR